MNGKTASLTIKFKQPPMPILRPHVFLLSIPTRECPILHPTSLKYCSTLILIPLSLIYFFVFFYTFIWELANIYVYKIQRIKPNAHVSTHPELTIINILFHLFLVLCK